MYGIGLHHYTSHYFCVVSYLVVCISVLCHTWCFVLCPVAQLGSFVSRVLFAVVIILYSLFTPDMLNYHMGGGACQTSCLVFCTRVIKYQAVSHSSTRIAS